MTRWPPPVSGCTRTRQEPPEVPVAGAVNGVPILLSSAVDSRGPSAAPSGPPAMLTFPSALTTSTRN